MVAGASARLRRRPRSGSADRVSPATAVAMLARGLSSRRRSVRRSTVSRVRRGRSSRSPAGRRGSPACAPPPTIRASSRPPTASTTATTTSTWNSPPSARSVAKVCRIGPGSASPLVSITIRAEPRHRAALALGDQAAQRDLQVGAGVAAEAAVAEQRDLVGAVAHQRVVDADAAELVDDDGGAFALRRRQEAAHQRGLAGAEEAGDDRHRNARAARALLPRPNGPASREGKRSSIIYPLVSRTRCQREALAERCDR